MMTGTEIQIAWLSDPRLAVHAMSPQPVWLWSADASRLLWANPSGAAVFDATSPAAAAALQFGADHPAIKQMMRLSDTLPRAGMARLERLRGFGTPLGGTLICLVSRIVLADTSTGILVVSTEHAAGGLALPERARCILTDFGVAAALYAADGEWIDGKPAAQESRADQRDLVELGAARLAREATLNGHAEGEIAAGPVTLIKLGDETKFFLLMLFAAVGTPATEQPQTPSPPIAVVLPMPPAPARRAPWRFVWEMDAANRFTRGIDAFAHLLGPKTAALLDRPWSEIAALLKHDPKDEIAQALATRNTWSGAVLRWPIDEGGEGLAIEMSGLPVFDRDRRFTGFRGFGICRDTKRLEALERQRAQAAPTPTPPPEQPPEQPTNVLPFRLAPPTEPAAPPSETVAPPQPSTPTPALSPIEHSAFQELARELNERLNKGPRQTEAGDGANEPATASPPPPPEPPRVARNGNDARDVQQERSILGHLPVGILVYRHSNLLYANRAFLNWTGYPTLEALAEAGGLDSLFIETKEASQPHGGGTSGGRGLTISTGNGSEKSVEGQLFGVTWNNENALALMIDTLQGSGEPPARMSDAALQGLAGENQELKAILDTATDGVLVLDRAGRVLSANRSAQALFGYEAGELTHLSLVDLLAPESRRAMLDHLDRLARERGAGMLDAGREAIGRVKQGGLVPLYITMGRIEGGEKLCAVLRDMTAWKHSEEELINARREAEKASTAKSEFLAKISHEIRTPLNAIIGFSELMMEERFGPVGNERYRAYLKDINEAGSHVVALINDLLNLSKIEAGQLELSFVSVNLNDLVQQCVAFLQPEANRQRVIIRSALPPNLPPIVADARSVRQIVLNILSNSIKFTGAGGQVIVSTALTDSHEVAFRVRDTGAGMSEKELQTALEPFREIATSARWGTSGTGLGLPITKALAEANHARFHITSRIEEGTLVEVAFPATRVLTR